MKIERSMAWWLEKARQEGNSAKEDEMPGTGQYSTHDCGGPDVCSGCSSWRHGVHDDGSGSPEALEAFRRFLMDDNPTAGLGDEEDGK